MSYELHMKPCSVAFISWEKAQHVMPTLASFRTRFPTDTTHKSVRLLHAIALALPHPSHYAFKMTGVWWLSAVAGLLNLVKAHLSCMVM